MDVWEIHGERFKELGSECVVENIMQSNSEISADIVCHLNSQIFARKESYKLIISKHTVSEFFNTFFFTLLCIYCSIALYFK